MRVLISNIKLPDVLQRRVVDEVGLESLAGSIRKVGIVNPLTVRKVGKVYELVAGFRRLMAAEMVGDKSVPVVVRKGDDGEMEAVKAAENREREDVNAVDEGEYYVGVMERTGWNQKEIARELGVSEGLISQRVKTATWEDETKEAVRKGSIKFSVARELEGIRDEVEKKRMVKVAIESGVSPGVAAQWRRMVNNQLAVRQESMDMEGGRRKTHIPQTVYVPCMACEGPTNVEDVQFIRVCQTCNDLLIQRTGSPLSEVLSGDEHT